jgi:hypothetical protein
MNSASGPSPPAPIESEGAVDLSSAATAPHPLADTPAALAVADRLARPESVRPTHRPVAPTAAPSSAPAVAGRRTPYRDPGPTTSPFHILLPAAVVAVGLVVHWRYYVTSSGSVEVVPDVPEAEGQVRRDGELKFTSAADRRFTARPGTYELVLVRPTSGYRPSRTEVAVSHGRTKQGRVLHNVGRP